LEFFLQQRRPEVLVKFMRFAGSVTLALALLGALARPAAAQLNVTSADIERLQENIDEASRAIAQLRGRDASLASQLQADLDAARDETAYFRVKLRRNESIPRTEYVQARDRVENIRSRARGDVSGGYTPPANSPDSSTGGVATTGAVESSSSDDVPVGTEFDVRVQNSLSSRAARVEDRFEATTIVDLKKDGRIVVPAGSVMRGIVSAVTKAGRIERKGSLTVVFDRITIDGRSYPIRATVTQAIESEGIKGEAGKIGAGAGVGAIIGGILGGVRGALAGILIGGGGTIAATEGKDVELPAGTVLRVRMDSGLNLR
jgi:hypothetical protein